MSVHGTPAAATVSRLGWTGTSNGRLEVSFVLDQLSHETEVRRNVVLALLDELEGAIQTVVVEFHKISDDDGHRSRHSSVAVNEHLLSTVLSLLDEGEGLG